MFKILKYIYLKKAACESPESRFLSLRISVYTQKIFSCKQAKKRPVVLILVGSPHHKGNSYNSTDMVSYRVFCLYVKRLINFIFYIYILAYYRNTVTFI